MRAPMEKPNRAQGRPSLEIGSRTSLMNASATSWALPMVSPLNMPLPGSSTGQTAMDGQLWIARSFHCRYCAACLPAPKKQNSLASATPGSEPQGSQGVFRSGVSVKSKSCSRCCTSSSTSRPSAAASGSRGSASSSAAAAGCWAAAAVLPAALSSGLPGPAAAAPGGGGAAALAAAAAAAAAAAEHSPPVLAICLRALPVSKSAPAFQRVGCHSLAAAAAAASPDSGR
mmetsp:Transcript_41388/g.123690  ORF Transcript_41388/g.123690 Transcript_41388/m.123690 type:complete len:229 (-) Transcript_41388:184-870(-)